MTDGIAGAALAYLFNRELFADVSPPDDRKAAPAGRVYDLKPRRPHFEPRAKAVIHFFMNGGPSQMDLFDPQAPAGQASRTALPGQDGRRRRAGPRRCRGLDAQSLQVRPPGAVGHLAVGTPAPPGRPGGRAGLHPLHGHHHARSRGRLLHGQLGPDVPGPAQPGLLGDLRTGQRKSEPSRLRGAARPHGSAGERLTGLAGRLPAAALSRNPGAFRRVSPAEPAFRGRGAPPLPQGQPGPVAPARPYPQARPPGPAPAGCPHRQLRAGGPHAVGRPPTRWTSPAKAGRPWTGTAWG